MAFHRNEFYCKTYCYGAWGPRTNMEFVQDQLFKAHRYRNKLVEIELERRKAFREILLRSTDLQRAEAEETKALERYRAEVKLVNQYKVRNQTGKGDPELISAAKDARDELKRASNKTREAKGEAKKRYRDVIKQSTEVFYETTRKARKESGLFWGTYLVVERRGFGHEDPGFSRYRGDGTLAFQFQNGIESERLFEPNTKLWIKSKPQFDGPGGQKRVRVAMRVGFENRKKPIMAEFDVALHRPFPEGSRIKWVMLDTFRTANKRKWKLRFSVEFPGVPRYEKDIQTEASVLPNPIGIDVGWRRRSSGAVRVAFSHDGQRSFDIQCPPGITSAFEVADGIKSTRDNLRNEIQDQLKAWLQGGQKRGLALPGWLQVEAKTISQWRSNERFRKLYYGWKKNRFRGDETIMGALASWHGREMHLWQYQTNLVRKAGAARNKVYRGWARWLADHYGSLVLENLDLTELVKRMPTDETGKVSEAMRRQFGRSAPGALRQALIETFSFAGKPVIHVPPEYTTLRCHGCLGVCRWDKASDLSHTCEHCGARWDQDDNAARNLLGFGTGGKVPVGAARIETPEIWAVAEVDTAWRARAWRARAWRAKAKRARGSKRQIRAAS